jgi:ligand-binding SRPBCC domain-containing protein
MPRVEVVTTVRAAPERCFDCARDLDLHARSMAHTSERAVAGRTTGLIGPGEEVTWRARHFGLVLEHVARISVYDRPRHFRDEMVRGAFARFVHDHHFEPVPGGTRMRDVLEFRAPWGPLGRLADHLVLAGYLERLLRRRNEAVRAAAEAGAGALPATAG